MSDNVYILGTGMIQFGRYPERSVADLGAEAALQGLIGLGSDCGVHVLERVSA